MKKKRKEKKSEKKKNVRECVGDVPSSFFFKRKERDKILERHM